MKINDIDVKCVKKISIRYNVSDDAYDFVECGNNFDYISGVDKYGDDIIFENMNRETFLKWVVAFVKEYYTINSNPNGDCYLCIKDEYINTL